MISARKDWKKGAVAWGRYATGASLVMKSSRRWGRSSPARRSSVPFSTLSSQRLASRASGLTGTPGSLLACQTMASMRCLLSEYAAHLASALRRSSPAAAAASA